MYAKYERKRDASANPSIYDKEVYKASQGKYSQEIKEISPDHKQILHECKLCDPRGDVGNGRNACFEIFLKYAHEHCRARLQKKSECCDNDPYFHPSRIRGNQCNAASHPKKKYKK